MRDYALAVMTALSGLVSVLFMAAVIAGGVGLMVWITNNQPPPIEGVPAPTVDITVEQPCEEGAKLWLQSLQVALKPRPDKDEIIEADRRFKAHLNRCFECAKAFNHVVEKKELSANR